ncbi:hypothetical protein [Microbacterium sp. P02]|uniref:hypothetical protein n=1 Tax=Microbacterium sp. P02 TaxID=3366260 RepID=UPI0036705AEF
MPYTARDHEHRPSPDELRARIPGWGADLDHADRPAFPREQPGIDTGAREELPPQQAGGRGRERSVEHLRLTPVFGTAQPLHGMAGAIRRRAYRVYSEGQTAHWLLLIAADRVDSATAHARSLVSGRPDDPITQSGVLGERGHHPVVSRFGRGRVDLKHAWLDPILVVGPWVLVVVAGSAAVRRLLRALG